MGLGVVTLSDSNPFTLLFALLLCVLIAALWWDRRTSPAPMTRALSGRRIRAFLPPVVCAAGFLIMVFLSVRTVRESIDRSNILRHGISGTAIVQRTYSLPGNKTTRRFLDLWYQAQDGMSHMFTARVGSLQSVQMGQDLAMHYLPERPDQAVLDDDYGFAVREQLSCAALSLLVLLAALWTGYGCYKRESLGLNA